MSGIPPLDPGAENGESTPEPAPPRFPTQRLLIEDHGELSEERLADYHAQRVHARSVGFSFMAIAVLSLMALVVLIPFLYMLVISLKKPAEMGNGSLLPTEAKALGLRKAAWVEVRLNDEQAVRLTQLNSDVPVLPAQAATFSPWPEPQPLPENTLSGAVISLEKPSRERREVVALLEVPQAQEKIGARGRIAVYLPSSRPGLWEQVTGDAIPRTFTAVLQRLFRNYGEILNWDRITGGNVLAWISSGYPRWFLNSLFVAICTVLLGVFLDSLAAFAFAKFQFPFKRSLFALLILTLMIPYPVTLVPTFFIFAELGFYNTYAALIIPGIVSAFGIFLVRQYMETIPDDMLNAARVDGASDFQLYRKIVLPTARPVLAALAIFRFIYQWNSYLYPLVLTNKDSMKTIQLGIATMEDMHGSVNYGLQMAGSAIAVLPILLVYAFMQKHFIAGITMGASKS